MDLPHIPSNDIAIKPAAFSKINVTQLVAVVAAFATMFGFEIPPELQVKIVAAIVTVAGLVTYVLRTYFTTALTPQSAKKLT